MTMETINRPPLTDKRFKMRVHQTEFLTEYGGRLPAGSVVPVDEETAIRWIDNGIAEQAPNDAKTRAEERKEEIRAELLRIEAEEARGGVYDAAITRESFRDDPQQGRDLMPKRMPPSRRGKRDRAALDPMDTVNSDHYRDTGEDDE
jgi:hypothetical protein